MKKHAILKNTIILALIFFVQMKVSATTISYRLGMMNTLIHGESTVDTHVVKEKKGLTELRKEIIELKRQRNELERNILGMQKRLADLFGKSEVVQEADSGADESLIRAQEAFGLTAVDASEALKEASFTLKTLLKEGMPQDDESRVRLIQKAGELQEMSMRLSAYVKSMHTDTIDKCRVIAIEHDLNVVVITAGYRQGVRKGLNFYGQDNKKLHLRAIELKDDLSLCEIITADVDHLILGTYVGAGQVKEN